MDSPRGFFWKVVGGLATAAIIAGAGLAWSTREQTQAMQVQLSGLCTSLPEIKTKVDRLELEVQQGKINDTSMQGRMYFLEKSLEAFEKRVERYVK